MYEAIKELEEKGLFKKAVDAGLISITLAGQKLIYEIYLNFRKKGFEEGYGARQSVIKTSIETNTSIPSVWRIIKTMEG